MEKPDLEYEYIVLYGYEYRFSKEECDKILHFAKSENCKVIALGERQFKSDILLNVDRMKYWDTFQKQNIL